MSISRYHMDTDIKQVLTLSISLDTVVNFYVIVVDSLSAQVKKMSLYPETGFIDTDMTRLTDYTLEVRVKREETTDWEFGNFHFLLMATYTDNGYTDAIRIDSNSKIAFRIVKDNVPTVNELDIIGALPTAGIGDMTRAVYDTNGNGIVDDSEAVNGIAIPAIAPGDALKVVQINAAETDFEYTENISVDDIQFDIAVTPGTTGGGQVKWNNKEYTIDVDTGLGPVLQVGQETYLVIYNDTGTDITNFTALRPFAATVIDGLVVPTVERAQANIWSKAEGTIMVSTMLIPNGQIGLATRFGRARGGDTSIFTPGQTLWLSATVAGELSNTEPLFPNYKISIGGALNSTAVGGEIFVSITRNIHNTIVDAFDGGVRETFDLRATSNGTVITASLVNADLTNDLTCMFSDGFYTFDTTPAATIALTPGSATVEQDNYVYILQSNKTLTVSTSGWPSPEHARVGIISVFTAARTQTEGALGNQNWNDHIKTTDNNGHILHLAQAIREKIPATHKSGTEISMVVGSGNEIWAKNTGGVIMQLHDQDFPVIDMETGDSIIVVNDFTTKNIPVADLGVITTDSSGGSLTNTSYSVVIYGMQNKSGENSHLLCNFPSDTYQRNSPEDAVADAFNYSDYSIAQKHMSKAALFARVTLVNSSGVISVYDIEDLRGRTPNATAGGGAGGTGVTTLLGLIDTPSAYTGQALKGLRVNEAGTATEFGNSNISDLTVVNVATYDLLLADHILHVTYTATAAVTSLTLPTAQTVVGRMVTIKDGGGNATANNITIDTEGSETIDGAATYSITMNYSAITLYSDGSNWFII